MKRIVMGLVLVLGLGLFAIGQNVTPQAPASAPLPVIEYTPYVLTPISATAAVGSAAVLTIPAPATGLFNYVCYLKLEGSADATGASVITNAVTTSTNFNSFAAKFSNANVANTDTGVLSLLDVSPPGCAKSAASATSTTFTSPTSTHEAYAWYALYFQAP